MASTTFIDGTTVIRASWLNDVNNFVYNGSGSTLQAVTNYGNTTTNTCLFGVVGGVGTGIGYQINSPTGTTVYGIATSANYIGMQSNNGGSTPYSVLLSGAAFLPYSNGSSSNSGIALGAPSSQWSSLGVAGSFYWSTYTIPAPSGSTSTFLRNDGTWATPSGGGGGSGTVTSVALSVPTGLAVSGSPITTSGTLAVTWSGQVPVANLASGTPNNASFVRGDGIWSNTLTGNASFGGVGIGNQLNAPSGTTVYGITSTGNYVGIQSNFGGSTPYTVLLSGSAFLPYSNGSSSNSGIALGAPASLWSSLGVAGTFYWSNATITAPNTSTGDATKFLNNQGAWVVPSGSGTGLTSVGLSMPTGFSVSGSPLTSNGTLSVSWSGQVPTANLGTGTASSSTYLRGDGTWATVTVTTPTLQQVATAGNSYSGGITTTTNSTFGGVGVGVSSSGPAGTTYGIGASASTIGIGNNSTQVYLYNSSFIPATNNALTLGASSYAWNSFYLASTFNWNGYGISAPAGNTSTYLRNDGTWGTPTGSVPSLQSVCSVGNSYSGGLAITGASYFGSASTFANVVELYTQTTASSTNALGAYVGGATSNAIAAVTGNTGSNLAFFGYGSPSSVTAVGSISTNGTLTVYGTTSDRRLKSNIANLTSGEGIAKIKKLTPRSFTWNSSNEADVGFIADELQSVVPNAVAGTANQVDENGNPIYQSVDNSFVIVYLIQAVQELIAKAGL